jgi:tRNA-splicing ligase RtcB (3'-phosphate/5'-hydroxy nucleic acid ligase)
MANSDVPDRAIDRLDGCRVALGRYRDDMRTGGVIYADRALFKAIQADGTLAQLANVATLPGIVGSALAMPDAHQGYGFPIGGVAATDAAPGGEGVVSPGGVGFDINCGVRLLATSLEASEAAGRIDAVADALMARIPVGFGKSAQKLGAGGEIEGLLREGARWAVDRGLGEGDDLVRCEEGGVMPGADPAVVSETAKRRGAGQLGTLGSGNHFVEVQRVDEVLEAEAAAALGLAEGQLVVLIHTGSRGLGHQVCTDAVHAFGPAMARHGIQVPDRQLACAPIHSAEGQRYLAAMAAAASFAWGNRQVITQRVREALAHALGPCSVRVVYDVAHNMAKIEDHVVDGQVRTVCVHRKGATRAFGPGHPSLPEAYRSVGQPAFVPGSMGTASYVVVGTERAMAETFGSICHGAGRALSRTAAKKAVTPGQVIAALKERGVVIRAGSKAGIVEEFPGAYKDVHSVIDVVARAGLARPVARLAPMAVVKG